MILLADSEGPDESAWMSILIWALAVRICPITKTYLYNFDPLKRHFYIVKLGFTGVYIIFHISAQKHRLWVLVRTASVRRFERVPTIYVLSRNMKIIRFFYLKIFSFLEVKFSIYLNRRVFVMEDTFSPCVAHMYFYIRTGWSGPSLSANRIIWHYRICITGEQMPEWD